MLRISDLLQYNLKIKYSAIRSDNRSEYYSYDVLYNEMDDKTRNDLFEAWYSLYQSNTIRLFCLCNPEKKIEMVLSKRDKKIHIRSKQDMKQHHTPGCNFEGTSIGTYHQNWERADDGTIHIRFEDSFTIKDNPSTQPSTNLSPEQRRMNTYNRITLLAFFKRLLMDSWNISIYNYKHKKLRYYPSLKNVYSYFSTTMAGKMCFGKNHTIKDVLFDGKSYLGTAAIQLAKYKQLKLMIMLELVSATLENNTYTIRGKHLTTNKPFTVVCDKEKWEEALKDVRGIDGPQILGAWVTKTSSQITEISTLALIPISSHGVPIESSYERTFYNHCHYNNRLIIRPYELKYFPSWQGMLPDGLLIDTEMETIVEIFGMSENQIEYHERKRHKESHFKTLKDYPNKKYDLWIWNAYKGQQMSDLP